MKQIVLLVALIIIALYACYKKGYDEGYKNLHKKGVAVDIKNSGRKYFRVELDPIHFKGKTVKFAFKHDNSLCYKVFTVEVQENVVHNPYFQFTTETEPGLYQLIIFGQKGLIKKNLVVHINSDPPFKQNVNDF